MRDSSIEKGAYVAMAVLACAIALHACTPTQPTPGDITIINTQTQGGGTGPGASPSPGAGGELPPGSFIRIGLFGQSCPSGVTPPANGSRQIKLGCTGSITATPKDASGADLPAAVHGPSIAWSVPSGSGVVSVLADSEPFNRSVKCLGLGVFSLAATVKGVTGSADFECVTSASVAGEAEAMDGSPPPPGGPYPSPCPAGTQCGG